MKKFFLLSVLALNWAAGYAQDIIVLKDGQVIKAKVEEVGGKKVRYKNFNNQNGPQYVTDKDEILTISYENGTVDVLGKPNADVEYDSESGEYSADYVGNNIFRPEARLILDAPSSGSDCLDEGFSFQYVAGFQVGRRWKVGPGIGIGGHSYKDDDMSSFEIPIFLQARYHFTDGRFSPHLIAQIGYNFGNVEAWNPYQGEYVDHSLGLYGKIGAGFSAKLKRGRIFFDLSYKAQQWEVENYSRPQYAEIAVGYMWILR